MRSLEKAESVTKTFNVGDKVRFTGKFLRSTGQYTGKSVLSKWTVLECKCPMCVTGRFICSDEKQTEETLSVMYTQEERDTLPHLAFRHIATGNLEKCK